LATSSPTQFLPKPVLPGAKYPGMLCARKTM
jgi:hypothetical protein